MDTVNTPKPTDSKTVWKEYADSLGLDVEDLTKNQIIDAVEKHEAEPNVDPTGPQTQEPATEEGGSAPEVEEDSEEGESAEEETPTEENESKEDETPTEEDSFDSLADAEETESPVADEGTIKLRFVDGGFTYRSRVWLKGEELSVVVGSPEYERTKDAQGGSWLDLVSDPEAQEKRWGRQLFEEIS